MNELYDDLAAKLDSLHVQGMADDSDSLHV
jgi:hypothetical protein